MDFDQISDILFDNVKKLFFPQEWLSLDLNFSKSEIFTLFFIGKRKEITMTELAEYINSPMSTASGIADRLTRGGYITRGRSESDRRIVVLKLSPEGSRLVGHIKDTISGYLKMITKDLTEEEIRFIISITGKIISSFQAKTNSKDSVDNEAKAQISKIEIE